MQIRKLITFILLLNYTQFIFAKERIDSLNLPPNFTIQGFAADLDSPRQITETADGHIIVGSKKGSEVVALVDEDLDGSFESKIIVANGLQNPAGVVFYQGDLYFAEMDTIWIIENIDSWLNSVPLLDKIRNLT